MTVAKTAKTGIARKSGGQPIELEAAVIKSEMGCGKMVDGKGRMLDVGGGRWDGGCGMWDVEISECGMRISDWGFLISECGFGIEDWWSENLSPPLSVNLICSKGTGSTSSAFWAFSV